MPDPSTHADILQTFETPSEISFSSPLKNDTAECCFLPVMITSLAPYSMCPEGKRKLARLERHMKDNLRRSRNARLCVKCQINDSERGVKSFR